MPPFVFKISATERFNTTDYEYNPSAIEIITRAEVVVSDVHSIHFRNDSQAVNENEAIRQVIKFRKELSQTNKQSTLRAVIQWGWRDIVCNFNNNTPCSVWTVQCWNRSPFLEDGEEEQATP